jgi:aquaporin Z
MKTAQPAYGNLFLAELIGTAILVLVGLSLVIFMFGTGTPMAPIIPDEALRRLLTGFLFGSTGALIALSPVGRISGAHINPAVTLGFFLVGKLHARATLGYICAQLVGGLLGALPLLAWGAMGRSVAFGATAPGPGYSTTEALLGEVITTFAMVTLLYLFLSFRESRPFTPALFPFLYAVMVCLEAPVSGTSTNPARSLGPAIVSGTWQAWWIYWVGPLAGMIAAVAVCSRLVTRIEVAKLYHFDANRAQFLKIRRHNFDEVYTTDSKERGI